MCWLELVGVLITYSHRPCRFFAFLVIFQQFLKVGLSLICRSILVACANCFFQLISKFCGVSIFIQHIDRTRKLDSVLDMPWNSTTARLSENSHSAYIRVTQWHVQVFTDSADPLIFTLLFPMSSFPTIKTSALWSGTIYLVLMVDLAFKFSAHWVSWKGFSAREWDSVKKYVIIQNIGHLVCNGMSYVLIL